MCALRVTWKCFKPDEIVYLSPDSDQVLQSVDADKVYVLGGLVDEHIQKVSITMLCLSLRVRYI